MPSFLQKTVVAGPPVEVQVRVNTGGSVAGSVSNWKVISPGIVTWPVGGKRVGEQHQCHSYIIKDPEFVLKCLLCLVAC